MLIYLAGGKDEVLRIVKVSDRATAMRASTSGRASIMIRALSAFIAMQAVASASAVAQSGAMTVAERVELTTGRPVRGSRV